MAKPMIFTPEQENALRTLKRVWATEKFVLIGASAISYLLGLEWHQTKDLDLILAVSINGYPE